MADIKVIVDYSDLTGLIKTSKQTEQSLSLVARSFAKTNDQKAYMTGINQIVKAQSNLDAKSRMSRQQIMKLGASMKQEALFAEQLAVATQKASTHINAMGKSSNRTGVAMQQTGYQVGDFLVQVQGGTNVMVAFGQQATQLVGVLYLLPQATLASRVALLGLSVSVAGLVAAMSIAIPLLTAIGAYYMRQSKQAKEAAQGVDSLSSALDTLSKINFSSFENNLSAPIIAAKAEFQDLMYVMETATRNAFKKALLKPLEEVKKELASFESRTKLLAQIDGGPAEYKSEFGLKNQAEALFLATQIKTLEGETKEELTGQLQAMTLALKLRGLLTPQVVTMVNAMASEIGAMETINEQVREQLSNTSKITDEQNAHVVALQKHKDKVKEANEATEESLRLGNQKVALLLIEQKYGKLSGKYAAAVAQQERTNLRLKLEAKNVSGTLINLALSQLRTEQDITAELERRGKVVYNLMEGRSGLGAAALKKYGGRGTTDDRAPTQDGKSIYSTKTAGKDSRQTGQEIVDNLLKQATHKAKLVGLNAEEARYEQLLYDMQNRNAKAKAPLDQRELEMAAKKIQAVKDETLARERQKKVVKDLSDTIGNAMSNSMMAIVDGTQSVKEAFKSMALDIVKHLYKVLVVQRMVQAFGGFLGGSGNAGIASIGNALSSYGGSAANGGPVSGGRSYLVGERGPEMFTPSMGGGHITPASQTNAGGVTVVQNINVSTGVQQTVRAEIRQMMPQIANSAKGAVLDAKRRGGSYGSAFA